MRKYVFRFLIIYKRIANAYTRCRRITNPTERVFTVPSVTVPYLFLVTGDMVTIELVNISCVRMRVRTQECFFLFLLSPRHLVIFNL